MKHWIFDFDGTLVNSDGIFYKALSYALEPFSVDVGNNFMEQIRHKHPHRIFEDHLSEAQAEVALQRMREIGQHLSENIEVFEGIPDLLSLLKDKAVSVSVWTGRDGASTHRILNRLGLTDYFQLIVSGTCVEVNKPGHDGLIKVQNHHQADFSEMIMVGDHHHDIEPANTLGVTSVHAEWKAQPHLLPEKTKPNLRFGSVQELQNWFLKQL